jgi:hypothetical protein
MALANLNPSDLEAQVRHHQSELAKYQAELELRKKKLDEINNNAKTMVFIRLLPYTGFEKILNGELLNKDWKHNGYIKINSKKGSTRSVMVNYINNNTSWDVIDTLNRSDLHICAEYSRSKTFDEYHSKHESVSMYTHLKNKYGKPKTDELWEYLRCTRRGDQRACWTCGDDLRIQMGYINVCCLHKTNRPCFDELKKIAATNFKMRLPIPTNKCECSEAGKYYK